MSESTLSLNRDQLEAKVGSFLGYGRGANFSDAAWTTRQAAAIRDCIESGLRRFYYPTSDGLGPPHSWSFLRPTSTILLAEGGSTAQLPDDFGYPEGEATIATADGSTRWYALRFVGSGMVQQRYSTAPSSTGSPEFLAVRPIKGTTQYRGQRNELVFWPLADQGYTLTMTYSLLMDSLSDANPYVYGGAAHAETVLESCLAVAESRLDDAMTIHAIEFQRRLVASIALDRRNKPAHLGYNLDRSDGQHWNMRGPRDQVTVTIAGQIPS